MSMKALVIQTLFALMVVYQVPALAGELQGNVLNCTYDLQRLDVTIGDVRSSADIPSSASGNGKAQRCTVMTTMQIAFTANLPAEAQAAFTNLNPASARSGDVVICFGRVEAGATSVQINLVNPWTCSFGKPRPSK